MEGGSHAFPQIACNHVTGHCQRVDALRLAFIAESISPCGDCKTCSPISQHDERIHVLPQAPNSSTCNHVLFNTQMRNIRAQ